MNSIHLTVIGLFGLVFFFFLGSVLVVCGFEALVHFL